MTIKASGRSALILAAGLAIGFAGPSHAAGNADDAAPAAKSEAAGAPVALNKFAKHGSHRSRIYAHRKSGTETPKSSSGDDTRAAAAGDGNRPATIPLAVANANAQLAAPDTPAGSASAMSARANTILQASPGNPADSQTAAETDVVAADQLNDVDRALQSPPSMMTMAAADVPATPAPPAPPVVASRNESSTWDQTSLIGKIFIAFGSLLTVASAARMFMA